jgi:hypothetical protein
VVSVPVCAALVGEGANESLPSTLRSLVGQTGRHLIAMFPRMAGVLLLEANGAQVQLAATLHSLSDVPR